MIQIMWYRKRHIGVFRLKPRKISTTEVAMAVIVICCFASIHPRSSYTDFSGSAVARHWAFGSSTPRDLAHMTAISTAQRIYDAKSPKKSTTSPEFTTPVRKRSTTAVQTIIETVSN
ncbi:unnamed protein product [Angiostrongylus costaricensis]|uniref:Secreted protein n=1 Tax=Angiostrongylus costaricensis TaxID=334426 RepID=A0A0R3PVN8_ANGCS|nr:unnamed protein product [Angiostrongylus costaricensis]